MVFRTIYRCVNNTRSAVHFTKHCNIQKFINYYQFFEYEFKFTIDSNKGYGASNLI